MNVVMKSSKYLYACLLCAAPFLSALTPGQRAADKGNGVVSDELKPVSIVQNNAGGRVLILSNGTKWEVYKKDTVRSGGWFGGEIMIQPQDEYRRSGSKYFRVRIFNKATNDSVWARKIGGNND